MLFSQSLWSLSRNLFGKPNKTYFQDFSLHFELIMLLFNISMLNAAHYSYFFTKNLIERYTGRSQAIISAAIYTASVLISLIVSYHSAVSSSIPFNLEGPLMVETGANHVYDPS